MSTPTKSDAVVYDGTGKPINLAKPDGLAIPHVFTFAGLLQGAWNTYYHDGSHEGFRHNRENALHMRNDLRLEAAFQERKRAVKILPWRIEVEDESDPKQAVVKDLTTKILNRIPRFRRMLGYLLEAVWWGRYGSQLLFAWEEVCDAEGVPYQVMQPVKHDPIFGDKLGFRHDGTPYVRVYGAAPDIGNIKPIYSTQGPAIPLVGTLRERFLIHTYNPLDADYFDIEGADAKFGVGLSSLGYWQQWVKNEFASWVTEFFEKVGLGLVMVEFESGNTQSEAAADDAIKNLGKRSVIKVPRAAGGTSTWGNTESIRILEVPASGATMIREWIEYFDESFERLIIGQSMSSGSDAEGSLGGSGRANLAKDTKSQIIEDDALDLEETVTGSKYEPGLIHTIVKYSFPWVDFPVQFKLGIKPDNSKERMEAIQAAVGMGVAVKEADVREACNVDAPEHGDAIVGGQAGQTPGKFGEGGPFEPPFDQDPQDEGQDTQSDNGSEEKDENPFQMSRVEQPEQYAADKKTGGHWVTMGGDSEEGGGKHHGGHPVLLDGEGRIIGGNVPRSWQGRHISEAFKPPAEGKTVKAAPAEDETPAPSEKAGELADEEGTYSAEDLDFNPSELDAPAEAPKGSAKERLAKHIADSPGLSDGHRKRYQAAVEGVLSAMPQKAHDALGESLKNAKFHPNGNAMAIAVTDAAMATADEEGKKALAERKKYIQDNGLVVAGSFLLNTSEVHLDGDIEVPGGGDASYGKYGEKTVTMNGTYSHEFMHAIDGADFKLSKSPEWMEAYNSEIMVGADENAALTSYAQEAPYEGLAEFGRLLYGTDVPLAQIEKDFPKASAFFKSQELWPTREGGSQAGVAEQFDSKAKLDFGKEGHADVLLKGKGATDRNPDAKQAEPPKAAEAAPPAPAPAKAESKPAKPAKSPKPAASTEDTNASLNALTEDSLKADGQHDFDAIDSKIDEYLGKHSVAELKDIAKEQGLAVLKPTKSGIIGQFKERLRRYRQLAQRTEFRPLNAENKSPDSTTNVVDKPKGNATIVDKPATETGEAKKEGGKMSETNESANATPAAKPDLMPPPSQAGFKKIKRYTETTIDQSDVESRQKLKDKGFKYNPASRSWYSIGHHNDVPGELTHHVVTSPDKNAGFGDDALAELRASKEEAKKYKQAHLDGLRDSHDVRPTDVLSGKYALTPLADSVYSVKAKNGSPQQSPSSASETGEAKKEGGKMNEPRPLKGSPAQVEWANKIRSKLLSGEMPENARNILANHEDAKFWIDNKGYSSPSALVGMLTPEDVRRVSSVDEEDAAIEEEGKMAVQEAKRVLAKHGMPLSPAIARFEKEGESAGVPAEIAALSRPVVSGSASVQPHKRSKESREIAFLDRYKENAHLFEKWKARGFGVPEVQA